MKNKKKDVPYCGVNELSIIHANPGINEQNFRYFAHFIKERYRIHKRKDVKGLPAPWTKDPILAEYRFTNVRREHDRVSRALIEKVSLNPELSLEDKIVNTFMFRAWNNPETFEFFDLPDTAHDLYCPEFKDWVREGYRNEAHHNPNRKWWSAAYNQGGTKYAWKFPDGDGFSRAPSEKAGAEFADYEPDIPLRVFHIPVWLHRGDIVNKILAAKDQKEVSDIISTVRGFADFLSYQIFVDLTYIPEFPFSENEFTVAGPGCKKGIDLVFDNKDGMTYEESIFWLRDNLDEICWSRDISWNPVKLFEDLPLMDRCMNVMSLENCFCEISKYIRTANKTGRPKVKYRPRKE